MNPTEWQNFCSPLIGYKFRTLVDGDGSPMVRMIAPASGCSPWQPGAEPPVDAFRIESLEFPRSDVSLHGANIAKMMPREFGSPLRGQHEKADGPLKVVGGVREGLDH
jgi:hypothetical protein